MAALYWLIPISLFFGALGVGAFFWSLGRGQFDDPKGDAERILLAQDRPLMKDKQQ